MKRVLTAVILIPIVVLALFRAPLWLFSLLVLGVALLAAKEYFDIAEKTGFRPVQFFSYWFVGLAVCCSSGLAGLLKIDPPESSATLLISRAYELRMAIDVLILFVLVFPLILLLDLALRRDPPSHVLPDAAVSFLVLPYVAFTLSLLPLIRETANGALYLLYVMLLVWCGDIAAYYVGRAIGKHKLAPRISPGKTWEGAVASVVGAAVTGVVLFRYVNPMAEAFRSAHLLVQRANSFGGPMPAARPFALAPVWFVVAFAICVNVAAQLGDLVESALKRGAGVKDSGTLLPGHGGVLDRIDALLFALPVGLIFYIAGMKQYFSYPPYAP